MKKLALIIIGISLIFVSCKKELDTPNLKPFPSGETQTVADLLEKIEQNGEYQFDTVKDASVEGWVIADEKSGNIYRTFYLRDNTGAIAVYRPSGSDDFNARTGDLVQISLKGAILGSYNGLPQIQLQEEKTNKLICIKQRDGIISPTVTTLADITQGKHLCDLVRINGVEFSDYEGHTYAENGANTNHGIEDCNGYSCIVRTSSYATFANDSLPKGKGSLICIVSLYGTDWQLLIRNTSDVSMDGPRCGQIGIFSEPFSSGQGGFTIQNVFMAQGLSWVWKYKSPYGMVGSAFTNNTSYESESWLISPAIDMNGFSSAVLTFEHAANKLNGSPADYYSVWVSTDYTGGLPDTATWTQLTVPTYPAGTNWTFVASGDIDMSAFLGNGNVHIAFRYTSEDGNSGSWEIKNVLINE